MYIINKSLLHSIVCLFFMLTAHKKAGFKLKSGRIELGEVNTAISRCFAMALLKIDQEDGLSTVIVSFPTLIPII